MNEDPPFSPNGNPNGSQNGDLSDSPTTSSPANLTAAPTEPYAHADGTAAIGNRLGAIDAGSNAIRMVIAEAEGPRVWTTIETMRVPVRLGHGPYTNGVLSDDRIAAAVAVFAQFRELFALHGVHRYRAVATSAVRTARNRDALLHRLYHEAGIELEVIDGDEEARLVRKAVSHAFATRAPGGTQPDLILDLGGGSLEINVRRDGHWQGTSLPIGTVRLAETFGLYGVIGANEAGMVRRYVATLLSASEPLQALLAPKTPLADTAADELHRLRRENGGATGGHRAPPLGFAAACGGNAEAFARLCGPDAGIITSAGTLHGHSEDGRSAGGPGDMGGFELDQLESLLPEILDADVEARMARFGVRRDRAEVMGVAALVFTTVARALKIPHLAVPGVGIRDALLLDLAEGLAVAQAEADSAQGKALLTSARTFANRVGHNLTHGEQVRRLAQSIFAQCSDIHDLGPEFSIILEVAALLHDVGEVVHPRSHHKHSEYMIRWGRIPGLEGIDRDLVAALVRTHRKSPPDSKKHEAVAALNKAQRTAVRKLAAILRLADGLDTDHRQSIQRVIVSRMGGTITFDLILAKARLPTAQNPEPPTPAAPPPHPTQGRANTAPPLAPESLLRKAELFAEVFDCKVACTVGTAPVPPMP